MKAEGYKGRKGADFNVMLVKRILDKENFNRIYEKIEKTKNAESDW